MWFNVLFSLGKNHWMKKDTVNPFFLVLWGFTWPNGFWATRCLVFGLDVRSMDGTVPPHSELTATWHNGEWDPHHTPWQQCSSEQEWPPEQGSHAVMASSDIWARFRLSRKTQVLSEFGLAILSECQFLCAATLSLILGSPDWMLHNVSCRMKRKS